MKWNDIGVGRRLWLVILGVLVSVLAIAVWAQVNGARLMTQAVDEVQLYEGRITDAVRWRGLASLASTLNETGAITSDTALVGAFDDRVKREIGPQVVKLQERIASTATDAVSQTALRGVAESRAAMMASLARVTALKSEGADVQAFVEREYRPVLNRYLAALDNFVTVQEQLRDAAQASAAATHRVSTIYSLALILVVFAIAVGMTLALVRSIVQPLQRAVRVANAIADGDLTQRLNDARHDEFGQLLQALAAMTERLRSLVGDVRSGVDSVSTASVQIASGNHDLSARTEQTASSLQQTAASMEQLTSTVAQSADTARQANALATTAAEAASQGGEVVGQVVRTMNDISEASRKIADIIGTIDAIAFQTNILALNAAVEAARAGEQGRGFAVVATEVRALAGRSAEAAKEIKALIGASTQTVEAGSAQVERAGASMQEIVTSVRRVSDLIGDISAASTEQRDGIGQVNQAVAQLDQMTQQNAALVEESAAAASGLRDQAQRLSDVLGVFKLSGEPSLHAVARPASDAVAQRSAPAAKAAPKPAPSQAARAPAAVRASAAAAPLAKPAASKPAATTAVAPPAVRRSPAPAKVAADDDWESF
jgi:methyl-accepting chemotaxis protein